MSIRRVGGGTPNFVPLEQLRNADRPVAPVNRHLPGSLAEQQEEMGLLGEGANLEGPKHSAQDPSQRAIRELKARLQTDAYEGYKQPEHSLFEAPLEEQTPKHTRLEDLVYTLGDTEELLKARAEELVEPLDPDEQQERRGRRGSGGGSDSDAQEEDFSAQLEDVGQGWDSGENTLEPDDEEVFLAQIEDLPLDELAALSARMPPPPVDPADVLFEEEPVEALDEEDLLPEDAVEFEEEPIEALEEQRAEARRQPARTQELELGEDLRPAERVHTEQDFFAVMGESDLLLEGAAEPEPESEPIEPVGDEDLEPAGPAQAVGGDLLPWDMAETSEELPATPLGPLDEEGEAR